MTDDASHDRLQNLLWIINDIDQLVEHAMLTRAPLAEVAPRALDRLLTYLPARALTLRVTDEEGELRTFTRPDGVDVLHDQAEVLLQRTVDRGVYREEFDHGTIYGQRLDMSVHQLGGIVAHFETRHDDAERDYTQRALFQWAEIFDNYIAGIREAALKQEALELISDAFKRTILEDALDHAIEVLRRYVPFDSLAVVCQSDEVLERSSYSYRLVIDADTTYSSAAELDPRVEALVEQMVQRLLRQELVEDALDEIGFRSTFVDDVPILGLDAGNVVGRIVLGTAQRLTPFESDIVDRFADYLRQRVVDFSREWRSLSRTFSKPIVERLMRESNYRARHLTPREETVAVMYTDIAGFTRLSEQVLRSPSEIGRLIDRWSRHVVGIIWETGGVFDKMVGDCIIGLWGPPFHEMSAAECCAAAVEAAARIRHYTALLDDDPDFPELNAEAAPIRVATGINYCPMFVGLFGPDEHFTGFSSGMNNAARLQGLATADEILCMDSVVAQLASTHRFGDELRAPVKNVAQPLRYRALIEAPV